MSIRLPLSLAKLVNKAFVKLFRVDVSEAEKPLNEYDCLQDFFVRRLKPHLRPVPINDNVVISPCDGTLSIANIITDGQLIQAKGKYYSLDELVLDQQLAKRFKNGHYATLYLSPRDYHRFHVPMDGEIRFTKYIKGSLWPVNNWAVKNIKNLFCQNERVITLITNKKTNLSIAHVAIGATMVGRIELAYGNIGNRQKNLDEKIEEFNNRVIPVKKGQELGRFMFGSTIVLLFEQGLIADFSKKAPSCVKMGEVLGNFL